ncbi:MAG: protein serine/threonine phosphatase [Bacteroidetes bacterium]|nr:protein serine/threonine phosphatase [Bacteroidota bacterium]
MILLALILQTGFFFASKSDSLIRLIEKYPQEDTSRARALYKAGSALVNESEYSRAIDYLLQSSRLSSKLGFKTLEAVSINRLGDAYAAIDENDKARDLYTKGLTIFESLKNEYGVASSYNDLGNLEETAGNYNKALKYFFFYLNYAEKSNSASDQAIAYNNISIIYSDMKDYKMSLAYNFKALKIREKLSDPWQLAASYNNMGVSYQELENFQLAVFYYNKALEIRKKLNDIEGVAASYHNLAICYKHLGDYSLAEEHYLKALAIQKEHKIMADVALTSVNLGKFYFDRKQFDKAFEYLHGALKISNELDLIEYKTDVHMALYEAYDGTGKPDKALEHFRNYVILRDSLNNVEQSKEFTRIEMQNKFDKELSARQLEQAKKDAVLKQQQKQQRIITISVTILLIIITVFLFFVYRSYKQKQQANIIITNQKQKVESQKHLIEEKQKEIIDSINYAKRIQSAILAKEEDIRKQFPESFLYYNPKDIVAGDFYFFEVNGDHIFYAAADCTGHGVPGALVSVVCSNALSRCVKEFGLTDPGKILDKTRELVVETFKKSGQEVKDGMDISLLVKEKTTGTYLWAGANNPLWFTHKGSLNEITANKQPIGYVESPTPFTTHTPKFESGDTVYLFTDGYADQFGGPKGKKFKYKQLELLLIEHSGRPAESQKEILENKFTEWKGDHEQVDDVLIIGITIS